MDHGLSSNNSVARLQRMLNPFQKIVGAGCQLTIDIEKELRNTGFKLEKLKKFQLEKSPKIIFMYKGIARKQTR
ncbi:MAG: hypothetical protein HOE90_22500 [Bacteriovoracaceae bacterium]|nr:hypothetical protein [Bacteriovoracaceae bacterium]